MIDLLHSPGRYIMRVSAGLLRRLDSFVEGSSMTPQEARLLQFIAAAQAPVCQRDLEAEYGCTAASISQIIKSMEGKGLIRRETDAGDRRRKCLSINPDIEPKVLKMRDNMLRMEMKLIDGIEPEKLETFLEVARRMSENIPPSGG